MAPRSKLNRVIAAGLLCMVANVLPAQAQEGNTRQQPTEVLDPYQGGWMSVEQDRNARLWQLTTDDAPASQSALLNEYRSARNASLARHAGDIPSSEKAQLDQMADRIATIDPNSFEAHLAAFYAKFPAPDAFMSLDLAKARDRERTELIAPLLVNAARTGNAMEMARWGKALKEQGGVAPGLWRMADDVLLSVEKDAVLIAAGEMDAYPLWSKQAASGARKDVLVVDQRLLGDRAYRERIWTSTRASGSTPGQEAFIDALAGASQRPVYVSLALGPQQARAMRGRLYVTGLAARYSRNDWNNIPALVKSWSAMAKSTDAGPLAKNYLLPASILLNHYRSLGDETNASRLEHELRGLAAKLGATNDLIRAGVLLH